MTLGVATLSADVEVTGLHNRSDAALAADGDTTAFERLYRAHVSRVHSLARRMMGPLEADELTQDVFVRAWQKLGTFRGESQFSTWLHRLAVNVILERRRGLAARMARQTSSDAALEAFSTPAGTPDLSIDFEAAIERLPDGARQIFVLHDVEGYKHREIAASLGISAGTSKTQLHRARMLLRRHLNRRQRRVED
jgi:RNA polymerase sigma-70 factor (ECF subfamily)